MVTDDGEIQGTVNPNTAMERLEDVISSEFVDLIDVLVDEDITSQPKGNLDVHTVPQANEVPGIHQSEYVSH